MLFLERVRTIALLCLTVFGCTGNILTLIVVNQHFFRKTTSAAFISALSIADCIVLFLQSFQIVTKFHPHVTSYDCVVFFLIDVFRLLSVWIICFINIERCSLVFNPCHMPRLNSRPKSRVFVLILFIISLLIFSHYGRHMYIEYVDNFNHTVPIRSFCAFKSNFNHLAWECIRSGLTYWSTVPLCIVCNCIIIKRLHQASRIERTLNNNNNNNLTANHLMNPNNTYDLSSKQKQLTVMLVTSSIFFVLTATPSTIHAIYLLITHEKTNFHYAIHIFTNILLHFHHASNFLAFIFSCARFRIELLQLFRRYFYCQIYVNWHKRSIPQTEQNLIYSSKQQKPPIRLLAPKTKEQKRNIQPYYQNGIVLFEKNNHKKNVRQSMQPFL
jgi:hypothetical protein